MLINHLKTAWQNLRAHKAYVAINTVGLAMGIAACLLVFLLVRYETGFDDFHANKERIYRVVAATKTQAGIDYSKASAYPVAQALRMDYPQLEHVARIYVRDDKEGALPGDDGMATQKKFKEKVFYADPEFFRHLQFSLPCRRCKDCFIRTQYGGAYTSNSREIFWRLAGGHRPFH